MFECNEEWMKYMILMKKIFIDSILKNEGEY